MWYMYNIYMFICNMFIYIYICNTCKTFITINYYTIMKHLTNNQWQCFPLSCFYFIEIIKLVKSQNDIYF